MSFDFINLKINEKIKKVIEAISIRKINVIILGVNPSKLKLSTYNTNI